MRMNLSQSNLAGYGVDITDLTDSLHLAATHRSVNLAGLARSIFSELRRDHPGFTIRTQAPARMIVDGDATLLRLLLEALLVPAWNELADHDGGLIEFGVAANDVGRVYFVHDDAHHDAPVLGDAPAPSRASELGRAADIVRRLGGRLCTVGVPGHGVTVLFTLPDSKEPETFSQAA